MTFKKKLKTLHQFHSLKSLTVNDDPSSIKLSEEY